MGLQLLGALGSLAEVACLVRLASNAAFHEATSNLSLYLILLAKRRGAL